MVVISIVIGGVIERWGGTVIGNYIDIVGDSRVIADTL